MKVSPAATARPSAICLACVCCILCVSCKTSHRSELSESSTSEIAVVARTNPNEPFAISPDGSFLVHSPSGVIQGERVYESLFDVENVKKTSPVAAIKLPVQPNTGFQFNHIEFCDHGRYLLAVGPEATIYPGADRTSTTGDLITAQSEDLVKILDMKSNSLHADISLGTAEHSLPPEALARFKQVNPEFHWTKEWHGEVQFAACAANAPIAAIVISYGNEFSRLKILNLDTGAETQGFGSIAIQTGVMGLAVSPQGSSLALYRAGAMPGGDGEGAPNHCFTLVNLQNKKIGKTIWVKSDDAFKASIAYAGESTVATELVSQEYLGYSPSDSHLEPRYSFHNHASVHFFDVGTGSELQVISDPSVDDFSFEGMSADGRIMLAYTGKSDICKSCNRGMGKQEITDARFTLWNRETGQPIARSPELKVIHHTCSFFSLRDRIANCVESDEAPTLKLDQDGNAVAASWATGGEPIEVYTSPSH